MPTRLSHSPSELMFAPVSRELAGWPVRALRSWRSAEGVRCGSAAFKRCYCCGGMGAWRCSCTAPVRTGPLCPVRRGDAGVPPEMTRRGHARAGYRDDVLAGGVASLVVRGNACHEVGAREGRA